MCRQQLILHVQTTGRKAGRQAGIKIGSRALGENKEKFPSPQDDKYVGVGKQIKI
jgi:hypothetical protein